MLFCNNPALLDNKGGLSGRRGYVTKGNAGKSEL